MDSMGVYFVLKKEEDLGRCLQFLQPLSDVVLLEEHNGTEGVGLHNKKIIRRFFDKEEDVEKISLLLSCLAEECPTGEISMDLGEMFFRQGKWKQAIFWYENAMREVGGRGLCLRLAICYAQLGADEMAVRYCQLARIWKSKPPV